MFLLELDGHIQVAKLLFLLCPWVEAMLPGGHACVDPEVMSHVVIDAGQNAINVCTHYYSVFLHHLSAKKPTWGLASLRKGFLCVETGFLFFKCLFFAITIATSLFKSFTSITLIRSVLFLETLKDIFPFLLVVCILRILISLCLSH